MKKIAGFLLLGFLFASLQAETIKGWSEIKADSIVPGGDNVPAQVVGPGDFSFTSDFTKLKAVRAFWDIPIKCNLANRNGLQFKFYCSGADLVSGFRFFVKSGRGWYAATIKPPENPGWSLITLEKADFSTIEGKVEGWRNITAIRLAAIRAGRGVLKMRMSALSYLPRKGCLVGVVRSDSCAIDPRYAKEAKGFAKFALNVHTAIADAGLPVTAISDMDIDDEALNGLKLLVFPYNPALPKGKIKAIERFVQSGGKIFACHSIDRDVRKAIGISEERYRTRKWRSSSETPSVEKNGYYLDHVWRYSIDESKRQIYDLLLRVDSSWNQYIESRKKTEEEKAKKEAEWIAGQPSKKGEWRAFWCHSEKGLKDHTWDEAVKLLKDNGFNAILPNLAWAGVAFYNSDVLPVHSSVVTDGDELEKCLAACKKYGVECHVWKVCWRLGSKAEKNVVEKFKSQERCQVSNNGKEYDWLCPSRPENLQQEIDAFVELAQKGVDGIHFDYIRYKNESFCFCNYCRKAFEKRLGRVVDGWPKAVYKGNDTELLKAWRQFRRDNITALVTGVAERVRKTAPNVKLSAAVFHEPERDPVTIGQDWVAWCKSGLLDFVCPMDYYGRLGPLLEMQKQALAGAPVKLRPGLGLSCWDNPRNDAIKMTEQIKTVRDAGLDGFSVFDFDLRSASVIPVLHTGPMK